MNDQRGLAIRPTPDQFDAAMAYAEEHGIGLERALLMQQHDQIATIQTGQRIERVSFLMRAVTDSFTEVMRNITEAMDNLTRSPAWPVLLDIAEAEAKRQRRAANRARWQARRRSR